MMKEMTATLYFYRITGYYTACDDSTDSTEKRRFEKEVWAESNSDAMSMVVGELAWNTSLNGEKFYLDEIHYECL